MLRPFASAVLAAASALVAVLPFSARAAEPPSVVASILPVQGLAAGVMEGIGTPRLLVPPGASPHAYALKPSDAAALAGADLVFWVDPALETFLPSVLKTVDAQARVLRLSEAPGVHRLTLRSGALWETHDDHDHGSAGDAHETGHDQEHHDEAGGDHDHDHDHEGHDHEEHDHEKRDGHDDHGDHDAHAAQEPAETGPLDPHLWLDPRNAIAWTQAIAQALIARDPERAALYRANAEAQVATLQALEAELAATLAPVADRPFLVAHDAYRYLEEHYGLRAVGALSLSPGQAAGARHQAEIRQRLADSGARCIFAEPQATTALAERLTAETGVRLGVLDPLGRREMVGDGYYPTMMRALVGALADCLDAP